MKNFILFLSLFIFLALCSESKAQPYYYNSGIPTLFENWGNIPGGGGAHPSSFGENTEYIIESGKTAVLDFLWFIDNSATLRVNPGATLQINYSLNIGSNAKLILDSNATCIYNSTEIARNTIFGGKENFHIYSYFKVDNWSSVNHPLIDSIKAVSSGISPFENEHYFGNLEINWTGCFGNWFIINREFVEDLCGSDFRLTSTGAGKIVTCKKDSNTQTGVHVNNYIQTGGELDFSFSSTGSGYASVLWVTGSFIKTGGVMDATDNQAIGFLIMQFGFREFQDTSYKTFQNSGTMRNIRIRLDNTKIRLYSNMDLPLPGQYIAFTCYSTIVDFGEYKITGNVPSIIGGSTFKIKNPQGLRNGSNGGSFLINGEKEFFYGNTIEYCGSTPQITGDSLPSYHPYINLKINNPNGVTLNKNLGLDTNNTLEFVSGKLNLGNFNLKVGTYDSIKGVNQNCFINTNGTGVVRVGLNGGYVAKFPIGNGTFSPLYISQAYVGNYDTIGIRVENGFNSHMPFDTSRCARKTWRVFDENVSVATTFKVAVQFLKADAGINMDYGSTCAVAQYETDYNGYKPWGGYFAEPFYSPPDSTISKAIYGGPFSTTGDDFFAAGNEDGVYETFFPDNTGDASLLGNWTSHTGLHPQSFDRYAIFLIPEGQTASFNNPVNFSEKAFLRSTGNGIINANAPLTINGILQIYDSSTYNHNNTGIASQTCFAGREFCDRKSNFNILKWSDTADKIFDESELTFGNLTINFNNLPEPFGTNKYWTLFKNILPYFTTHTIRGNLVYLNSSGYQFAPIGYGDNMTSVTVWGNVQIGDSLNQTVFPTMNLSGGTTRPMNSTAGTLFICGNLDIQNGGLTCQDFPQVARGRIIFKREDNNVPQNHTFYCYKPFLWQTLNLGSSAFPNLIEYDTLTLKSDMYNASSPAFLFQDYWQVESGAALNIDTFKIKSINLKIKSGGKLITKNAEGFYAELATQNVVFEPNAALEFAGSTPQNLQKSGAYNLTTFPNLIINNPANVRVNVPDVAITGSITFLAGKLISDNTNYLTTNESVQYYGVNANSFLSGPLKINTSSMNTITIPLGKGSNQRNLVITPNSSNSTDWIVEYFNQQQPFGNTLGAGITSISSAEYFLINRSGAMPSNAVVGLSWGANSGVSNPVNLRVARWNDFQWEDKGNSSYTGDATGGIVYSNMISQFSPFAIASTDNQQLPVELSLFNASADRNNVILNWVTETEVNNSGYEIERKYVTDTNWKKVNFLTGAGNSNTRKIYKYEDRNLAVGTYSYRLKQIDYNGNHAYYNLQNNVSVGIPNNYSLSQNYPNPFNPTTKINFELPKDTKVTIQIYDMTGRLINSLVDNQSFSAGYHTVDFNAINLASGTYFYRISAGEFIATKKMQLVK